MALSSDNYSLTTVRPLVVRVATVSITFVSCSFFVLFDLHNDKLINIRYMYLRLEGEYLVITSGVLVVEST